MPRTFLTFLVFSACLFFACQSKGDISELESLVAANRPLYDGKPVSPEIVEEIRRVLDKYKREVRQQAELKEEIGLLYKSLAIKYLELDAAKQDLTRRLAGAQAGFLTETSNGEYYEALGMELWNRKIFGEALMNFKKALGFFPENELLYYYAAVCAARLGKASVTDSEHPVRASWFSDAEAYYREAIRLDPGYADAMYGLAVLLVYELDRTPEAEGILLKLIEVERLNTDAYFLLANVYYLTGQPERAITQYETIESITTISEKVEQARKNRDRIVAELYGTD